MRRSSVVRHWLACAVCAFGIACGTAGTGDSYSDTLTDRGTGAPSDPGALAACATTMVAARRLPVYMQIVLDGSGSMNELGKWGAATGALQSFFSLSAVRADPGVAVGLTVFSDSGDRTQGVGPYARFDVAPAFADAPHVAALGARLTEKAPLYQTPMAAALGGQFPLLEAFAPTAPLESGGKRVLVLVTDGVPYPNGASQRPRVLAAVKGEAEKAITTFVVGVGAAEPYDPTVYDPAFLGQVALAGGAAREGCDPSELLDERRMCHLQIDPTGKSAERLQQELFTAVDGVRSVIASCELAIAQPPADMDPTQANVVYTDTFGAKVLVLADPVDGWTWDDPKTPRKILLHGNSCTLLKSEPDGEVSVVVGCKTLLK